MIRIKRAAVWALAGVLVQVSATAAVAATTIRVGYFANFTHAQPLTGKALGTFEQKTGARIEWKAFNAGPSAMEALLAGAIDLAYVGPNPAINAYVRSRGKSLRIVAGAASGGAGLVVRGDAGIRQPQDLKGKRIASPELGNTQDISLRHWLKAQHISVPGDVKVMTIKNTDILSLFQQRQLDAAWVPEPWMTRLLQEGQGRLFLDERSLWPSGKFTTAILVARTDFLRENRDLVKRFVAAHVELTDWISRNPEAAKKTINGELARLLRKPLPVKVLDEAFSRVTITHDPLAASLLTSARYAWELGYLPGSGKNPPDLGQIMDLSLLNEILREGRRPPVRR